MRKLKVISLAITLVICGTMLFACSKETKNIYDSGDGTQNAPYVIKMLTQLKCFAQIINDGEEYKEKHFILEESIDLGNEEWLPIGISTGAYKGFRGSFNGNGKIISNFKITSSSGDLGLFAVNYGEIKNLNVHDFQIYSNHDVQSAGGLVGFNLGEITNCSIIGEIDSGSGFIGGLVGRDNSGAVRNSRTDVNIFASAEANKIGGLIGSKLSGSITSCYSIGDVSFRNITTSNNIPYVGG